MQQPDSPAVLDTPTGQFFSLTPERVLDAVELGGVHTTGLCYALNSLENRVYEVELDGGERVVAKFYRPQRWSREQILVEHRLLAALADAEIPVCPPRELKASGTLATTPEGILFALFPRVGGRSPDELTLGEYEQLGRLLGRIHNVSSRIVGTARPPLSPETYGRRALQAIFERAKVGEGLAARLRQAAEMLVTHAELRFAGVPSFLLHADCHRGNLLKGSQGFFFLDFDDAAIGPAVQDFWLLLPARPKDCPDELGALVSGYEAFREFPHASVRLIEVLRALRYLRYAGWIAARWDDPAFSRAFPQFGTESYWEGLLNDLLEQASLVQEG